MTSGITIRTKARFERGRDGRTTLRVGEAAPRALSTGRLPRVTRLLALAHRFEKLIQDGEVQNYAELARLGHVTRARVTQIMNLLNLAPDIQEEILCLPAVKTGDDPVRERQMRRMASVADWERQRRTWATVKQAFNAAA